MSAITLYSGQVSKNFEEKLALSLKLLGEAQQQHGAASLTQASSLGAEDMVVTQLLKMAGVDCSIFVLNTGKLHDETVALIATAEQHFERTFDVYQPQADAAISFVQNHGEKAMYESLALRKACCEVRKMEPLRRALAGKDAWITGLRQEQSNNRASMELLEKDNEGRSKYNPLVHWTWGDVWHFIAKEALPYNPLHDQFFPSIGCAPCTRAISVGEDFRSGRWWWEDAGAKECGLHVHDASHDEPQEQKKGNCIMTTNPNTVPAAHKISHAHLAALEEESIYILREVAAAFERPALLFSGGKDSLVMLKLAEKAFGAGRIPFPLLMIDTGHNFHEVTDFRDFRAKELQAELIVRSVEDSMQRGTVRLRSADESRNVHQSVTLLEAIEEFRFDALLGGARRDEEKARAKERIFSHRDGFGQWNPKHQRPELWSLFNTKLAPGEHFRVFPISNWTELDIWEYIADENIALPSLYYAHERQVVLRKGLLAPVTDITPPRAGEVVETRTVRFRTVGDVTCTCPVESTAANATDIVQETLMAEVSERGATRMDDKTSDASMENRKKEGYF